MGEFTTLIQQIKEDKEKFYLILDKMKPLIDKYCRILYKDESDDTRAELSLSLWEAIQKISVYENDAQIVTYLKNAVTNRFHELYRKSCKWNNLATPLEDELLYSLSENKDSYNETECRIDLERFIEKHFSGAKKEIYFEMLIWNYSDTEISEHLHISRQYVNRMRKSIWKMIEKEYT
ncbi:MAG: RNA polymerase sigma factor [Acetatifactor sp.]